MKFARNLFVTLAFTAAALAQGHDHPAAVPPVASQNAAAAKPKPELTEAQKAFAKLKTVEGVWEAIPKVNDQQAADIFKGVPMTVTMRVTSRGNAFLHDMKHPNIPDNPITMFYMQDKELWLTHFCDAGNRPRMTGKVSSDGKRLEYDFIDITGPTKYGHMKRAVITFGDENNHTQEWTFQLPDKEVLVRLDLTRKK
jgi:hypothetical protein